MKKYKKQALITMSFIIPFLIYTIIFFISGALTKKTIIFGDMEAQYFPLFNYLKDMVNGTSSIFYSFTKGPGGTMFGTFFYYLSSPLNILITLIDKSNIIDLMTWLIIIKLSLCGLTMYLYMRRKYKNDNIILLVFSICYSLMGYNINYFINIMWLDIVFLTPIVLIGLEKIIEKKSPILYIIALFISILSNYYIAYMLCIFCIIYFIYNILLKYNVKEDKTIIKKLTKKFIISSILAGLTCSLFLIPCIAEMTNYGRGTNLSNILKLDYNFFDIFSKTYIGSLNLYDTLNYTSMNLYCGIFILPLVYLYMINKNIDKKERKLSLLVILLMILPCFIYPLNYIWHLFTIPSFYSYRYSYLLCFFLINIAYKSYNKLEINKKYIKPYIMLYTAISVYFIIISCITKYYDFITWKEISLTLIILIIYLKIFKIQNNKKRNKLFITLALIELILNISIIFIKMEMSKFPLQNRSFLNSPINEEIIENYNKDRIEVQKRELTNFPIKNKYNGINIFLSTSNKKYIDLMYELENKEIFKKINYYSYMDESFIKDSLIGLRYIIAQEELKYKLINTYEIDNEKYYIYENENSLGLGYIIKNECNKIDFSDIKDQELLNCITNENKEIYKKVEYKKENNTYKTELNKKGIYYIMGKNIMKKVKDSNIEAEYNSSYIKIKNNSSKEMKIELKDDTNINIYYFDFDEFNKQIKKINEKLNYEIKDNKLKGKITTEGGILALTLPYEKGYEIKVDGKNVKYKRIMDAFVGIDLEKGTHEIEVQYNQPYLKTGIIISIISLLGTIIYVKKEK